MLINVMDLLEAEVDKEIDRKRRGMSDYDQAPTDPHHGGKIWEIKMEPYEGASREELVEIAKDLEKWCGQYRDRCSTLEKERDELRDAISCAINGLSTPHTPNFNEVLERLIEVSQNSKNQAGGSDA